MKVIFISGYPENAMADHGVADPEAPFLQKPASVDTLIRKVRSVLNPSEELKQWLVFPQTRWGFADIKSYRTILSLFSEQSSYSTKTPHTKIEHRLVTSPPRHSQCINTAFGRGSAVNFRHSAFS